MSLTLTLLAEYATSAPLAVNMIAVTGLYGDFKQGRFGADLLSIPIFQK